MNLNVYVDGESHWIRSEEAWRKLHGKDALLEMASNPAQKGGHAYPNDHQPLIRVFRKGKFFWDTQYSFLPRLPIPSHEISIDLGVYFTDFAGGDEELHSVKVAIRDHGFEPHVIKERSQLAKHRGQRLATEGVLEKPKGLDIGLTVRVLEDAFRNLFDLCYLFTSDIDYAPVIHAIQHLGKRVVVFGYRDGQGTNSELEHLPDQFVNLEYQMSSYIFTPAATPEKTVP